MKYRKLVVTLVIVIAFGMIGSLSGPRWTPQPLEQTIVPATSDVAIGSEVMTDPVGTYEIEQDVFEIELGGAHVLATLTAPVGAPGERPGVLFMHGAGTGAHTNFADQAVALASAGVYVLVPEKRLDTYTTASRDYPAMAQDYLVSWAVLRDWPGVNPDMVGVYGESEGAWIAPIAAAEEPAVGFVILVSAPVVPPREQMAFAADSYLRNVGVPEALLRAIPRGVGAHPPGGGFEYADFDAGPWQRQLTQPVLMIYGTDDASMPIVQGPLAVIDDMAAAGNADYTVRYFEGANHGVRVNGELAEGFLDVLARWTLGLPVTADAEPRIAGDQPEQRFRAAPLDHPHWYADGDMLVWTLLGAFVLLLVAPAVWAVGRGVARLRGQRPHTFPPPLARFTAATMMSAVAIMVVFVAYVAYVASLALNYRTDDLVVHGGWVALHALGILAVAVGVRSVDAAANARRTLGRTAFSAGHAVIWWSAHLGATSLLVIAAYWGVFPTLF
ncbi:alpha/beta hydrolase family protein [Ruania halotolerans]|uniref:alpha/beta hydrolase family protein n=1 Tax=Ruania halotolerans TaxID=2897773 RepID=UPI001E39C0FD|nr:acyl-CoA thioester hydrolase/BAAT C-terminal domain-containing protein [Ruania halotolerans]UFU04932.1 alpha/beta hydrolase [Ruania halotolerans]